MCWQLGKTPSQLADEITRKLREYVQNPVVAISVKEVNSYSIFVLGEVVKPGKYPSEKQNHAATGNYHCRRIHTCCGQEPGRDFPVW